MIDTLTLFCAQYLIALPVAVAVLYFFYTDKKKEFGILMLCGVALAFVLGRAAGLLWYDPLPFVVGGFEPLFPHAADNGFVSDHTVVSAAIASVFYFFNKRAGALLMLAAALIGAARMLAGVHHLADVAGAVAVAVVAVLIVRAVYTAWVAPPQGRV